MWGYFHKFIDFQGKIFIELNFCDIKIFKISSFTTTKYKNYYGDQNISET